MSSSTNYEIRAILDSRTDPDTSDALEFVGTFGVWQDLSSTKSWSITVNDALAVGDYLQDISFEIRNKTTQEIVATTSGDFLLSINVPAEPTPPPSSTTTEGPFYITTSGSEHRWIVTSGAAYIYWDGVTIVSSGLGMSATSYTAPDGAIYTRGAVAQTHQYFTGYYVSKTTTTTTPPPTPTPQPEPEPEPEPSGPPYIPPPTNPENPTPDV